MAGSKNNISNRQEKVKGKFVTSDNCLGCQNQCKKGIEYLRKFAIKHEGNGVFCIEK